MGINTNRRSFLKYSGAASVAGLVGLAGCSTESGGGETPDVLMVVGYPQSGVQLFKDYYADYGDDTVDILVTDGLQDGDLPGDVGNDMSNVQGSAPSAAGPGVDTFESLFTEEFDYDSAGVFTSQAYDASAVQILANLMAGANDGASIRDHMRVVANPGGTQYTPSELPEAAEAAAAGENIEYAGASSNVNFDDAGDITAAQYQVFGFTQDGVESKSTIDFGGSGDVPQPEPSGSGSGADRAVRLGVLQPETGDLGSLGQAIRDAALLPARQLNGSIDQSIETQVGDTQSTAEAAVNAANSLVSAGYPSITGAASSEATIQVARNVLVDNEVVACSPASTSPTITNLEDDDFVFRTPPSDALQGQVLSQIANEDLEASTASTLYLNNSYGQALQESFVSAFEESGGSVLQKVGFESQQSSYTSQINSALNQ
ncbi:ABC transporter substrate-binding protein [Haloarcula onubensis]|uniref:ABC transporter substrate-binding protein n=1 Tax=Haloarcula onubensis TaxID=2950539 RepID=A0ABU2FTK4_9EURY|nr:ABC transporter substrate-binding protein [Halomicroarcula sp. S3CR25-11]MDS0284097.1 ABC transporter substrate-binding protein [Halomicroarcula sp. S3CR25-11]